MNWTDLTQDGKLTGSFEHGIELQGSKKGEEFV
jgi:hypothetical protein